MTVIECDHTITIKCEGDIIESIEITEKIASSVGFDEKDQLFLKLVTEEACMNSYEYIQANGIEFFNIYWKKEINYIKIILKQKGKTFNLHFNETINKGERGRGLKLIFGLVDRVLLSEEDEYITFSMEKSVKQVGR